MPIDVRFLRDFYATRLGQAAAQDILRVLREMDLPRSGKTLCLGYGVPFLDDLGQQKSQKFWAMPARQGIMPWPPNESSRAVLVEESRLPFAHETFDTVVILHTLEFTRDPEAFLQEILRVSAHDAAILVIVPNRLGLWAHRDQTPLGYGHPYSIFQLTDLLRNCSLKITVKKPVLSFFPHPSRWATHRGWALIWPQALAGAWCVRLERDPTWAVAAPKPAFVYSGLSKLGAVPQPSACRPLTQDVGMNNP